MMNFNDRQVRLEGIGKQIDAESGEVYENVLEMAPVFMYDFKVEVKRQYEYCQAVKSEH